MRDVNRILLVGRLGKDPVKRETKTGTSVVNFSMATSRKFEDKVETEWHKIVVWGKQGEACNQFLGKGASVLIEGSMRSRKYTTDKGESKISFEVHADNVTFLDKKRVASLVTHADLEAAADVGIAVAEPA